MYVGHVSCCPLVSQSQYADETDGRTDAKTLHYAFHYKIRYNGMISGRTLLT